MTDPKASKHDPFPVDPKEDQGTPSTEPETDIHVPKLAVAWQTHPSFNTDPKDLYPGEGDEAGGKEGSAAEPFTVNLKSVGEHVNNMLGTSRELVNEYEALKAKVMAHPDTVFGQTSMTTDKIDNPSSDYLPPGGTTVAGSGNYHSPTEFQKPAQEFARLMNPHQQKTLEEIGAVLDTVGQYIARVNHAGQVYAEADRKSKFPDPPAGSM